MDIEPVGKTEYALTLKKIKTEPFPQGKKKKPYTDGKKDPKKRKNVDVKV